MINRVMGFILPTLLFFALNIAPHHLASSQDKPKQSKKYQHSASCPNDCKTCKTATENALRYLSENFPKGLAVQDTVRISLMGLAFLSDGSTPSKGQYLKEVTKCKESVLSIVKLAISDKTHGNWSLSFTALFLTEIYNKEPDDNLKNVLTDICKKLEQNQESDGGWSHGPQPTSKYRSFSAVTELSLAALINLKKAGINVSESAISKGIKYLENSTLKDGAVSYSKDKKSFSSPARTAMAIYDVLQEGEDKTKSSHSNWISALREGIANTLRYAHGSFHLCFLYTAIGSYKLGSVDWKNFKKEWLDYLINTQNDKGASQYIPEDTPDLVAGVSKGMNWESGSHLGPVRGIDDTYRTAILAIILQLPLDNLTIITGKVDKKK